MSRSRFIQLTVTNALWLGVTENSVLVPISKITSLLEEGLWQISSKAGFMNKSDIQIIKNLKILNNRISFDQNTHIPLESSMGYHKFESI